MARPRSDLHDILLALTDYVYFQPPNGLKMTYPCIVYQRDTANTLYADNVPHRNDIRYMVTVIDRDPDSAIPGQVAALPYSTFNRFYTADNLNHDVYNLYF
jgi:hypothetical protein